MFPVFESAESNFTVATIEGAIFLVRAPGLCLARVDDATLLVEFEVLLGFTVSLTRESVEESGLIAAAVAPTVAADLLFLLSPVLLAVCFSTRVFWALREASLP